MASVCEVPVDPPPSVWEFPPPSRFHPDDDLVATGADLEPGTVLAAYRHGLFPMPMGGPRAPMAWFSPVRRGVLRPGGLKVSRSLRKSAQHFELRVDTSCAEVIDACADLLDLDTLWIKVEFTQHSGDEMYHPHLGGFNKDWTGSERQAD